MMNAIDIAKRKAHENRTAVWNFFMQHPCHTRTECAATLGLSSKTVGVHCRAIRAGWRPKVSQPVAGISISKTPFDHG